MFNALTLDYGMPLVLAQADDLETLLSLLEMYRIGEEGFSEELRSAIYRACRDAKPPSDGLLGTAVSAPMDIEGIGRVWFQHDYSVDLLYETGSYEQVSGFASGGSCRIPLTAEQRWSLTADGVTELQQRAEAAERERDELANEKKARNMIDPITRMHNLCDNLAEHRHESPYDEKSWALADESFQAKCAELKTAKVRIEELQQELNEQADSWNKADNHKSFQHDITVETLRIIIKALGPHPEPVHSTALAYARGLLLGMLARLEGKVTNWQDLKIREEAQNRLTQLEREHKQAAIIDAAMLACYCPSAGGYYEGASVEDCFEQLQRAFDDYYGFQLDYDVNEWPRTEEDMRALRTTKP